MLSNAMLGKGAGPRQRGQPAEKEKAEEARQALRRSQHSYTKECVRLALRTYKPTDLRTYGSTERSGDGALATLPQPGSSIKIG